MQVLGSVINFQTAYLSLGFVLEAQRCVFLTSYGSNRCALGAVRYQTIIGLRARFHFGVIFESIKVLF